MDIPAEQEAAFNRIYDKEHIATILKHPVCRSCTQARFMRAIEPSPALA